MNKRLPRGQNLSEDFPVLHFGEVPKIDLNSWKFEITGLVEEPHSLTYGEFTSLPAVKVSGDFHCVTGWSKTDVPWEGVPSETVVSLCRPKSNARFVMVHSYGDFSTNLRLNDFLGEKVLFAFRFYGKPLPSVYGGPLRLVVPGLYAWKSAKWVKGVEFMAEEKRGFWESRGYHIHGDPWKGEKYSEQEK